MKTRQMILPVILLLAILLPCVSAVEYPFTVVYDVLPPSGNSDDEILVYIRVPDHPNPNEPLVAYVFWDSRPIVQRESDVVINKIHQHRWDIIILPPKDLCSKGTHAIKIWIEDSSNNIVKWPYYSYTIKDTVPQLEWWGDLPQDFIDMITGPKGEAGETGPRGPQGIQGISGEQGETGATGSEGQRGDPGPQGPVGQALVGPAGIQGESGTSVDPLIPYTSLGIASLSLIIAFILWRRS